MTPYVDIPLFPHIQRTLSSRRLVTLTHAIGKGRFGQYYFN